MYLSVYGYEHVCVVWLFPNVRLCVCAFVAYGAVRENMATCISTSLRAYVLWVLFFMYCSSGLGMDGSLKVKVTLRC